MAKNPIYFMMSIVIALAVIAPSIGHSDDLVTKQLDRLISKLKTGHNDETEMHSTLASLVEAEDTTIIIEKLEPLLSDDDADVRANAILAVGNLKDSRSISILAKALTDPSGLVRHMAGYLLWAEQAHHFNRDTQTIFLNAAFEEFFHSEFLLTLNGDKPVSIINRPADPRFRDLLDSFRRSSEFTNSDIGWFYPSASGALGIYSRSALKKLIENTVLAKQLRKFGFPEVRSVDETIAAFENFWAGGLGVPQPEFDGISGLFFGYPLAEVLSYSGFKANGEKPAGLNINLFPNFAREQFFGWLVVKSAKNPPQVEALLEKGRKATERYHHYVATGKTATEILNAWDSQSHACDIWRP